jgi:hypothetical protein
VPRSSTSPPNSPGQARSTGLFALASELPAALLARLLGIHIAVAVAGQPACNGDWTAYAADVGRRSDHQYHEDMTKPRRIRPAAPRCSTNCSTTSTGTPHDRRPAAGRPVRFLRRSCGIPSAADRSRGQGGAKATGAWLDTGEDGRTLGGCGNDPAPATPGDLNDLTRDIRLVQAPQSGFNVGVRLEVTHRRGDGR